MPANKSINVPKIDQTIDNVTNGYGIAPKIGNVSTCTDNAASTGRNAIKVIIESTKATPSPSIMAANLIVSS